MVFAGLATFLAASPAAGQDAGAVPASGAVPAVAARPGDPDSIAVVDDLGRRVLFPAPPCRIVSLIPATTEIIYALGADRCLVGRSIYDNFPPEVRAVPDVGHAIGVAIERVVTLRPDLVLLVAGSDNARTVAEFDRLGVRSLVFRMNRLEDLRSTIARLGAVLERPGRADSLWSAIDADLNDVRDRTTALDRPTVYYDIAHPPPFTIGRGSYLDSLIFIAGGRNVFHDVEAPSPTVSLEAIVARDPDVIVFPVSKQWSGAGSPLERPLWNSLRAVRDGRVREVDADLLHKLGPRVGIAVRSLARAIHPELASDRPLAP